MERKRLLVVLLTISILVCGGWWFQGIAQAAVADNGLYLAPLLGGSGEYAWCNLMISNVSGSGVLQYAAIEVYTAQLLDDTGGSPQSYVIDIDLVDGVGRSGPTSCAGLGESGFMSYELTSLSSDSLYLSVASVRCHKSETVSQKTLSVTLEPAYPIVAQADCRRVESVTVEPPSLYDDTKLRNIGDCSSRTYRHKNETLTLTAKTREIDGYFFDYWEYIYYNSDDKKVTEKLYDNPLTVRVPKDLKGIRSRLGEQGMTFNEYIGRTTTTPKDLTLSAGPQNPSDKPVEVPASGDWDLTVQRTKLTAGNSDIALKGLTYDFIGDDPTGIAPSLDLDTNCDGSPERTNFADSEGGIRNRKITYPGLNETIPAGKSVCYSLNYLVYKSEKPLCQQIGASISSSQVEAYKATEQINVAGGTIKGTVIPGDGKLTLTVTPYPAEGGTVTKNPDKEAYDKGELVTLTATPNEVEGYQFDKWATTGASTSQNPLSFNINQSYTIYAQFKPIPPSDGKKHGKTKDPVNTATGEFYFDMPLFNLGGPLPLACGLYYGSGVSRRPDVHRAFRQELGPNWLHNYQVLRLYKGDLDTAIIYDRGKTLLFRQQENEWKLASSEDVQYVLKADEAGYYYLLDPAKELVYVFNTDRRLGWIADRKGNLHTLTYDASGYLSTVSDGLGRTLHYTYSGGQLTAVNDGQGRSYTLGYTGGLLTSVTDSLGQTIQFTYDQDGNGLITGIIYPRGNTPYTQTYDAQGRVASQTDAYGNVLNLSIAQDGTSVIGQPDGTQVRHTHRNAEVLTKSTDPDNRSAEVTYDESGRQTGFTDRMGDTTNIGYDTESGNLSSYTDAMGSTTNYTYTPQSQDFGGVTFIFYDLTRVQYADGTSEEFTYDNKGNILTKKDRRGQVWQSTYNDRGQILTSTNPAGGVVTNSYNPDGTLASTTTTDTGVTSYEYDAMKRLVKTTNPDGTSFQKTYDLKGRLTGITDENGNTLNFTYDANGNLLSITNAFGKTATYEYDLMDRQVKTVDSLGNTTAMVKYDPMGRPLEGTDALGNTTTFGYNAAGRLVTERDGAGKTRHIAYDEEGVEDSTTTPLGHKTEYQKDKKGNVTKVIDPSGSATEFTRDALNRITAIKDALGKQSAITYDAGGMMTGITRPGARGFNFERNSLGLLSRLTDFNGQVWSFTYTPMGRIKGFTDPLGNTWSYDYDGRGRKVKTTFPGKDILNITYDGVGKVTGNSYSDGTNIPFTYDPLNRIASTDGIGFTYDDTGRIVGTKNQQEGAIFGASYDAGGRLLTATYEDGLFTVTYEYDARDLLTRVSDSLTNSWVAFSYDDEGRPTKITRSNGITTDYTYDGTDRVTGIVDGTIADQQYTYDSVSRLIGATLSLPVDAGGYLNPGTDNFTFDAASEVSNVGYTYDARGRLIASPLRTFRWDGASRLIGIDNVTMEYNGLGDLTSRTEDGKTTAYYYNYAITNTPIIAEKDLSSGKYLRSYVWAPGGALLYGIDRSNGNSVFFYHFDRIGSTLFLTNRDGVVADFYAYSPYGIPLHHEGMNGQPFTYLGMYGVRQEAQDGLYHMRARYYDAKAARFLSRDPDWLSNPLPEELNPYGYANADPLKYIDPEGTVLQWVGKLVNLSQALRALGKGAKAIKKPLKKLADEGAEAQEKGTWRRAEGLNPAEKTAVVLWEVFIPGADAINDAVVDGKGGLEEVGAGILKDVTTGPLEGTRAITDVGLTLTLGNETREAARNFFSIIKKDLLGEKLTEAEEEYKKSFRSEGAIEEIQTALGLMVVMGAEGAGQIVIEGTKTIEKPIEQYVERGYKAYYREVRFATGTAIRAGEKMKKSYSKWLYHKTSDLLWKIW